MQELNSITPARTFRRTGARWIAPMILMSGAFVFSSQQPSPARDPGAEVRCDVDTLPPAVALRPMADYPAWKIQGVSDLAARAREDWAGEEPRACPGVAVGRFENDRQSYALLLRPADQKHQGYRLVVMTSRNDRKTYDLKTLDQSDGPGSENVYIRTMKVDARTQKRFGIAASEGILLVNSGESEYEANLYFWTRRGYRREWVDR